MLRSGTSVGTHCRDATCARSSAEFVSKMKCELQEPEETVDQLELLVQARIVRRLNRAISFKKLAS